VTVYQAVAAGRLYKVEQDVDRSGFAGSVGTEKTEDFSRLDVITHVVQGQSVVLVSFGEFP
jgi:hypothetical protein